MSCKPVSLPPKLKTENISGSPHNHVISTYWIPKLWLSSIFFISGNYFYRHASLLRMHAHGASSSACLWAATTVVIHEYNSLCMYTAYTHALIRTDSDTHTKMYLNKILFQDLSTD